MKAKRRRLFRRFNRFHFTGAFVFLVAGIIGTKMLFFSSAAGYGSFYVKTYVRNSNGTTSVLSGVSVAVTNVSGKYNCSQSYVVTGPGGNGSFTGCYSTYGYDSGSNDPYSQYRLTSATKSGYTFNSASLSNSSSTLAPDNSFYLRYSEQPTLSIILTQNPAPTPTPTPTPTPAPKPTPAPTPTPTPTKINQSKPTTTPKLTVTTNTATSTVTVTPMADQGTITEPEPINTLSSDNVLTVVRNPSRKIKDVIDSLIGVVQSDPNYIYSDGTSGKDDPFAKTNQNPPAPPSNLRIYQDDSGSIALSWDGTKDGPGQKTHYIVERLEGTANQGDIKARLSGTSWTDTTEIKYTTVYSYRIYAEDSAGNRSNFASDSVETRSVSINVGTPSSSASLATTDQNSNSLGTEIHSKDNSVSVQVPSDAHNSGMSCALSDSDVPARELLEQIGEVKQSIRSLVCRDESGAIVKSLDKEAQLTYTIPTGDLGTNSALFAFDGTDWSKLFDAKTKITSNPTIPDTTVSGEVKGDSTIYTIKTKQPLTFAIADQKTSTNPLKTIILIILGIIVLLGLFFTLFVLLQRFRGRLKTTAPADRDVHGISPASAATLPTLPAALDPAQPQTPLTPVPDNPMASDGTYRTPPLWQQVQVGRLPQQEKPPEPPDMFDLGGAPVPPDPYDIIDPVSITENPSIDSDVSEKLDEVSQSEPSTPEDLEPGEEASIPHDKR